MFTRRRTPRTCSSSRPRRAPLHAPFRTPLRTLAIAVPLLLMLAVPAVAGPPWIAIEYPVNPHDPETRDALLVVRTYHHDRAIGSRVTAEAIRADGARTTSAAVRAGDRPAPVPLRVEPTSRAGVYAVRGELARGQDWVIAVTRENADGGARATALVALSGAGEVVAVRVPHRMAEDGMWVVPRDPTQAELDGFLATAVAMSDAARRSQGALGAAGAALLLLVVAPSGVWALRRRRERADRS